MKQRLTRIELAMPFGVGAALGLSSGIVAGMMAGAAGVAVGIGVGAVAGVIAGLAMHNEEGHRALRSRELDETIGLAGSGDLGAAPVSMPPSVDESSRAAWLAEWLTPPPPAVG
jgi:hypothetical protein